MAQFQQMSLMTRTWNLLKYRKRTLENVSAGTGIPHHWLRKFLSHEIHDPSVNRIQKLYEFLADRQLEV